MSQRMNRMNPPQRASFVNTCGILISREALVMLVNYAQKPHESGCWLRSISPQQNGNKNALCETTHNIPQTWYFRYTPWYFHPIHWYSSIFNRKKKKLCSAISSYIHYMFTKYVHDVSIFCSPSIALPLTRCSSPKTCVGPWCRSRPTSCTPAGELPSSDKDRLSFRPYPGFIKGFQKFSNNILSGLLTCINHY